MAVARTHHTRDYTCMSNYHFKDKSLSLKAKGLLSLMLSLPDEWDYSVAGLASLSNDGETSVRTAVKELESHNYLKRTPIRENGRISDWEYDVYEKPIEILEVENQQVETSLLENKDNKVNKKSNTKKESNNKTNSKELVQDFEFGKQSHKKENLYSKCLHMIDDFTDDTQIRIDLQDYLQLLLEMRKDGLNFYANNWKGLLRKLKELSIDADTQHKIICQSIEKGYKSFFPVNDYMKPNKRKIFGETDRMSCEQYTEQELEELRKLNEERERQGLQTKF